MALATRADGRDPNRRRWLVLGPHLLMVLVIGAAFLFHGFPDGHSTSHWTSTTAVVLDGRGTAPNSSQLLIDFQDARGTPHRVWMAVDSFVGVTNGTHIRVTYDPAAPVSSVQRSEDTGESGLDLVNVGLVAAVAVGMTWYRKRTRRKLASSTIDREQGRPVRVWWAAGAPGRLAVYDRWPSPMPDAGTEMPSAGRMLGVQVIAHDDRVSIHDAMDMELLGNAKVGQQIALRAGEVLVVPATPLAAPDDARHGGRSRASAFPSAFNAAVLVISEGFFAVLLRTPWNLVAGAVVLLNLGIWAVVAGDRRHAALGPPAGLTGGIDQAPAPPPPAWNPKDRATASGASAATLFPTLTAMVQARKAAQPSSPVAGSWNQPGSYPPPLSSDNPDAGRPDRLVAATFAILLGLIGTINAWPVTTAVMAMLFVGWLRRPRSLVYRTHRPALRWWLVLVLIGPTATLFQGAFGAQNHTPLVGQVVLVMLGMGLGALIVRVLRSGVLVTPDHVILRNVLHTTVVERTQVLAFDRPVASSGQTRSGLVVRTAVGGPRRASRFAFPRSSPLPPVAALGAIPDRITVPHTFA